ncbi:MAG: carboxypeptidase M32 [Opitutales bacterium]
MIASSESTYDRLVAALRDLHRIKSTLGLLHWDQQVNLPPASSDFRAEQVAALSELAWREAARPEIGDWLCALESDPDLDADARAVVKRARRDYEEVTRLPGTFVRRKAEAGSKGYHAWHEARSASDFSAFQDALQEQLDLAREQADLLGHADRPYDYWVDHFDPGMTVETIDRLFSALQPELLDLVQTMTGSPNQPDTSFLRGFDVDRQATFVREVIGSLGFDWNRGRLDTAIHPFCSGHAADTRLTTRYHPDVPLDSLFSSIHEAGHGLYEQGLDPDWLGTALGSAVGMAVHESQSRLWENQIGRSPHFWQYWEPRYRVAFAGNLDGVTADDLYRAICAVSVTPIRVDSDEVTYNLHIMLRFLLEKQLFDGSLAVRDLPEAWNARSEEMLGFRPTSDAEGVLQDVHWSSGGFGYFPSYCLGNLLAAQLWYSLRAAVPDLDDQLARGETGAVLTWLRKHVHARAARFDTQALSRAVTGQPLGHHSLIRYLRERYLPLYT